ncbi:MAG: hypothetical protein SGILL_009588, partial [Bacillariaceae sp.]
ATRSSTRSVNSINDSSSKEEHLLSQQAASPKFCGIELPTTAASKLASNKQQYQHDSFKRSRDEAPVDFYLPLTSNVDDDPTVTVFDEAKEMLLSAILMYGVVHLRTLARKQLQRLRDESESNVYHNHNSNDSYGRLESSGSLSTSYTANTKEMVAEQLLALPISAKQIVSLVSKHRDAIVREVGREATVDLYLTAFDAIQSTSSSRELELELNSATFQVSLVSFDVVVVEDEKVGRELVYAICVDTARRRITVCFRGCSCRKDWMVCCQTTLKEVVNPLYDGSKPNSSRSSLSSSSRQQSPTISVHTGYHDYLFSKEEGAEEGTKFDSIMNDLNSLLQQYPGYNVYVTGHSLGAALATVFAFHAAASGRLTSPDPSYETPTVTCINFASPMVGNLEFENAFRELEDQGKIRCLRVTNYYDIFTQLPDRGNWLYLLMFIPWIGVHLFVYFGFSFIFFMWFQQNVYRHVGMNLHMYRGQTSWLSWWPCQRLRKCNQCKDMDDPESNLRYWYKVKHSNGTSEHFVLRVIFDFKTHIKQLFQRLLAFPFLTNFNMNHSAKEHLRRIKGLENELRKIQMKDMYDLRSPPSSPNNRSSETDIPTNWTCIV